MLLDSVGNLTALVMVDALEDGDGGEEVFVAVALVLGSILHNMIESVAVKLPKVYIALGHNGCSTWSIVQECKLSEGLTRLVRFEVSGFSISWVEALAAVELALLHNEEHSCDRRRVTQ